MIRLVCSDCGAVHACQENPRVLASAFRCGAGGCTGVVTYPGPVAAYEPDDSDLIEIHVPSEGDATDGAPERKLLELPADEFLRRVILGQTRFAGYRVIDVEVRRIVIHGTLRFENCVLVAPVFNSVTFNEPVELVDCELVDAMFAECEFDGTDPEAGAHDALRLAGCRLVGTNVFQDCTFRNLRVADGSIEHGEPDRAGEELMGSGLFLTGGEATGPLRIQGTAIDADVELRGMKLDAVTVDGCEVDADLRFIDLDIRGTFELSRLTLDDTGYLTFDDVRASGPRARITRCLSYRPLRVRRCTFACDLVLDRVRLFSGLAPFTAELARPQDVYAEAAVVLERSRLDGALRVIDSVICGEWRIADSHITELEVPHEVLGQSRPGTLRWAQMVRRVEVVAIEDPLGVNLAQMLEFVASQGSVAMARRARLIEDTFAATLEARRAVLLPSACVPERVDHIGRYFRRAADRLDALPDQVAELEDIAAAASSPELRTGDLLPRGLDLARVIERYAELLDQWWMVYLWGIRAQAQLLPHRLRTTTGEPRELATTFDMLRRAYSRAQDAAGTRFAARQCQLAQLKTHERAARDHAAEFPEHVTVARRYTLMFTIGIAATLVGLLSLSGKSHPADWLLLAGPVFGAVVLGFWLRDREAALVLARSTRIRWLRLTDRLHGGYTRPGKALLVAMWLNLAVALVYALFSGSGDIAKAPVEYSSMTLIHHLIVGLDLAFNAYHPGTNMRFLYNGLNIVAWFQRLATAYLLFAAWRASRRHLAN